VLKISVSINSRELEDWIVNVETNLDQFKQYLGEALQETLTEVVEEAKQICPVQTGRLRDSIRLEPGQDALSYYLIADPRNDQGKGYGLFVHEGSEKQPSQPFFEIALNDQLPDLIDKIQTKAREVFRKS
jgi:hypothetical protein